MTNDELPRLIYNYYDIENTDPHMKGRIEKSQVTKKQTHPKLYKNLPLI